jgi:PAS domain S-box-containing protein
LVLDLGVELILRFLRRLPAAIFMLLSCSAFFLSTAPLSAGESVPVLQSGGSLFGAFYQGDRLLIWPLAVVILGLAFFVALLIAALLRQRRAEEQLRLANLVVENSPAVLFRWKAAEGWPVELVSANISQYGYTRDELLSGTVLFSSMIHPDDLERVVSEVEGFAVSGADRFQQEFRIVAKDGGIHWIDDRTVIERDRKGNITHFQGIVLDITEARLAQEKLRQSEAKFSSAFHASLDAVNINRLEDGMYLDVNEGFSRLTGFERDEVIGRTSLELNLWVRPGEREYLVREVRRQGFVTNLEAEFRKKDGSLLTGQMSARLVEVENVACIVNIVRDITERKRAEERLSASLAEKIVLLKEVHHRVKNNLQIISSLLELQSDYMEDEESLRFVRESQNRINSMALVHEKLYQSQNFTSVNLGDYIESLTRFLCSTFLKDTGLISLALDVGDVTLGIDEAIPCGLIINELVSNSLKHAFPDGGSGEIAVSCHESHDGRIVLTVADSGIGLSPGLDIHSTGTLGLQLVSMLVKQLRGEVEVSGGEGTIFTITFPWSNPE